MSEFSDSIHVYKKSLPEVEGILEELKIPSAILGCNDTTVSVLMDWNDKVKIYDRMQVLDYCYGEDHGLWLRFYNREQVAKIELVWDDSEEMGYDEDAGPKPEITRDYDLILIKNDFVPASTGNELKQLIDRFDRNDWSGRDAFINSIGTLLDLFSYRWMSFEGFTENLGTYRKEFPDLTLCNM